MIPGYRRQRGKGEGLTKPPSSLYPGAGTHTGSAHPPPPGIPVQRGDAARRFRGARGSGLRAHRSPQRRRRAQDPIGLCLSTAASAACPLPPDTKKFAGGKNGLEINAHHCSARRACFPVLLHVSKLPVTEMRKQQPSPASGRGSGRNL